MNTVYLISPYVANDPNIQPSIEILETTLADYFSKLTRIKRDQIFQIDARHGQDANQDLNFTGDGFDLQVPSLPSMVFIKDNQVITILEKDEFTKEKIFNTLEKVYGNIALPNWIFWLGLAGGTVAVFKSEQNVGKGIGGTLAAISSICLTRNRI